MQKKTIRRIGFISTRIAGTDGVSLEIEKWSTVLARNGYVCFYFSGESDRPAGVSRVVPEAHFSHPAVMELQGSLFGGSLRPRAVTDEVHRLRARLKDEVQSFITDYNIDLVIPENIFAIPMNVPLGLAVTEVIAETNIPVIAHHHDFSWERERFLQSAADDFLAAAFPPVLSSMRHAVINSIGAEGLALRRGVSSVIVPNVYDFATPPRSSSPEKVAAVRKAAGAAEKDPLVLQPTRIIPRKGIERAIDLVAALDMERPLLLLSHAFGDEGDDYWLMLREYAEIRGVECVMLAGEVSKGGGETSFSFADIYGAADFITYPSLYEGFGNALLEAVYYRRPFLVNRYPVFISDLEPLDFDCVKMDGFISHEVVEKVREMIYNDSKRKKAVKKNYTLGERFFSFEVLEKKLRSLLESFMD